MNIKHTSRQRLVTTLTPVLFRADGSEKLASSVIQNVIEKDGGPGSGNWGHEGREGEVGGSAPGGGKQNRITKRNGTFTSNSKRRIKAAKPHVCTEKELLNMPNGTKITNYYGNVWQKLDKGYYINMSTGKTLSCHAIAYDVQGKNMKLSLAVPKTYGKQKLKGENATKSEANKTPDAFAAENGCSHEDDAFTSERRNNALKPTSQQSVDDMFREQTGKVWRTMDEETKQWFSDYTDSEYQTINDYLRMLASAEVTAEGLNSFSDEWSDYIDGINNMTEAIGACTIDRDIIIPRGSGRDSVANLLGCDPDELLDNDFLKTCIGRDMTDHAFMSCGTSIGTGMSKQCRLEIYCPKGTKGMYAEPFSACGKGDKINWDSKRTDGRSKQSSFSGEQEMILQRNTTLRITDAYFDPDEAGSFGGRTVIRCEVIRQDPRKLKKGI